MSFVTLSLPHGLTWTPEFATAINAEKCIGCGRCFRVCARSVMQLMGIDEDGNKVPLAVGDDDEDSEYEKKVMIIAQPEDCIGCGACARICPKKAHQHEPRPLAS
jgi:Nif-specific ferredoxin III